VLVQRAGFIGANLVARHQQRASDRGLRAGAGCADVCGARIRWPPSSTTCGLVQGDITARGWCPARPEAGKAVVIVAAATHVTTRSLIPSRFCPPTWLARSRCWKPCASPGAVASRVPRKRCPETSKTGLAATVNRVDAVQPVETVLGDEGSGRMLVRAWVRFLSYGVAATIRTAPTTKGRSTRGDVHSPPDHQRATGRRPSSTANGRECP